ncbi:hypothetical protein SPRG_03236 [Saprolegnia parasitica CBS 223.65]|uniref:Uncharacterized protein n=1 Tax=Saprolegnia parasitica (strain CBS 223.65) TaxID=695850 RepID=A0A067CMU6_SAPPC|nr:hypothetical protein SPRG_03236 [Saprolegnia parasitica CBS 223.65]KDO32019.1 hypothetical protein SPRG_03236 [Saprolegnia parasitica CBS 223.65]|eukprot:XP_012197209.1 hypothetical protein SPRG_03236 [Saprolegnia parasitica CBS 223.65]
MDAPPTTTTSSTSMSMPVPMMMEKKLPSASKKHSGMNGGRWTDEEHESFLLGLNLYGREWKRVASKIKTRTSAQIRSHAQKYFAKLAKDAEMQLSGEKVENPVNMSDEDDAASTAPSEAETDMGDLSPPRKPRDNANDDSSIIPSQEELLSTVVSPVLRERVSTLVDAEVCALQVLSWYAASATNTNANCPPTKRLCIEEKSRS